MAGPAQQNQDTDNSLALLWGILLAFALLGLTWFFFSKVITVWVLKIRLLEARLISVLIPDVKAWVRQLESLHPHQISFAELAIISSNIGRYLRFPISLLLLGFGVLIYLSRAALQFQHHYSMQTLVALEQDNWKQIAPVVPLDLINTPLDSGPWAMASTPFQFAEQYNLLELEYLAPPSDEVVMVMAKPRPTVRLKREAAQRVLIVQLGEMWQGVDALMMPAKALFAVFTARIARDRKAADQLLLETTKMASRYINTPERMHRKYWNCSEIEDVINQHQSHPLIVKLIQQHAYVLGVMASMLVLAREDGVLASADFLWLKPYDRTLWFMLNCIGRQTVYTEVAGPFAHWMAERAVGRKLQVPVVDTAVDALSEALKEVRLPEMNE